MGVMIESGSASRAGEWVRVGDHCRLRSHVHVASLGGTVSIGNRCSINPYSVLYGAGGLVIGDCVRIAAHTIIVAAMHIFDRVDLPIMDQGSTATGIVIEDDVWVGANVCILDGIRVGTGAVIAAGAVVTKDVPSRSIVAGVPARRIGAR